jgi:hypothetical protein
MSFGFSSNRLRREICESQHYAGFQVGGVSVQLTSLDATVVNLVPSLEPFRIGSSSTDIAISVEWANSLDPTRGSKLFDSGSVWRLYEGDAGFQFDFSAPLLGNQPYKRLLVDRSFKRASLQMSDRCFAGTSYVPAPLEYPLDELLIMHRLTQEKAIELHGCGIVRADGIGNLFVGHSGAGKSTTTRLWTALEDVEVLSDDRIIVRRHEKAQQQVPRGFASRHASEKQNRKIRIYGTPWHGEAMYASPNSAPLARIFILEHGHGNVLTPLSPSQAVAELFARSFVPFHRHEYVESALTFLEEVVENVPVYRFAFEPDHRAVDTILNLHD